MVRLKIPRSTRLFTIVSLTLMSMFVLCTVCDAGRKVRLAAEQNLPIASVDQSGRAEGFMMDIAEYVAGKEGWTVTYVACDWHKCLSMLKEGKVDLLAGIAYSDERAAYADFTGGGISYNWGRIYTREGKNVDSYLQLEGKRIAVVRDDTHNIALRKMLTAFGVTPVYIEVGNYEETLRLVAKGSADAAVVNRFFGLLHEKDYDIHPTNLIFNPVDLRFATPKGRNGYLIAAIDRHVKTLKADKDSIYYRSLNRWTASLRSRQTYPDWIKWAIIGVLAAACLVVAHNHALRTRVRARTKMLEKEVAERVHAEKALLAEKDMEAILTENAPFGMVMVSIDGSHVYVNPKYKETFGYGIEDIPDRKAWFRKAYPDRDYRHEMIGKWLTMIEESKRGEIESFENRVVCADGSLKIAKFRPVRLDSGEILITAEDITERKHIEEELARHREHLEELVRERTEELVVAREKAESADRLKSAFLATMSHELRTPLNSIIGFTGLLIQGLAGPINSEQRKQLGMVQNSSRHLLELINDVLDISKIEAGQLTIAAEPFDFLGSMRKVADIVAPLAEKKGLVLEVKAAQDAGAGTYVGDKRRVEQIVINLLNNAIKFTEKGRIELSCSMEGSSFVISVSDTGIGIAEEDVERVFMPFRQVDTGLSRRHEGTGLGLSITKKLVKLMGGEIAVQSMPGEGSTFTVNLPAKEG